MHRQKRERKQQGNGIKHRCDVTRDIKTILEIEKKYSIVVYILGNDKTKRKEGKSIWWRGGGVKGETASLTKERGKCFQLFWPEKSINLIIRYFGLKGLRGFFIQLTCRPH